MGGKGKGKEFEGMQRGKRCGKGGRERGKEV